METRFFKILIGGGLGCSALAMCQRTDSLPTRKKSMPFMETVLQVLIVTATIHIGKTRMKFLLIKIGLEETSHDWWEERRALKNKYIQ
jgi:sulfite reductase beta subunit-like hemoprotein